MIQWLSVGRLRLALHTVRPAPDGATAVPLLLLHGLGERSPAQVPAECRAWPGAVLALDFTGHGRSSIPVGGGYTCEGLMVDAVAAIKAVGPCTLMGRGLGAYVALMATALCADLVRGTVLRDGPGLAGGGDGSLTPWLPAVAGPSRSTPDHQALADLATDVRHPAAAARWAQLAREASPSPVPLHFCLSERPLWALVAADALSQAFTDVASALAECLASPVPASA
jgi:pimeloyl-ACP methyl ester carboxylesterase